MGSPGQRVRQALRGLRGAPGFSAAVVLALAVGMGVGIPVLGLVRGAALRPVPYSDPLLRQGGRATGWLPGGTADRQTLSQLQDQAFQALLGVLLALTLLLLAIALIDLLTLLLARAAARRPEAALRVVLGATPGRLAGHLLREGAVPLALGGGLGLAVAAGAVPLLRRSWPGGAPPWGDTLADGRTVAAVAGVFVLVPLLARLSPVGLAWRRDLRRFLTTGRHATAGRGEIFTRQALAVVQIAASIVLLTGAGLLLRGFAFSAEGARELGFDPRDTLTVQLHLPGPQGLGSPGRQVLSERVRQRLAALPGVVDTSVATPGAWLGLGATDRVTALCRDCWEMNRVMKPASDGLARIHAVSPGFFRAVGAPLLRGRDLGPGDGAGSPRVAVINDTFAYRLFPRGTPLGRSVLVGGSDGEWYTVVGIVDDLRATGVGSGAVPVPAIYLSTLQHGPTVVSAAVRTSGDPMRLLPAVEAAVHAVAPGARLSDAMTMERYLARFRAPVRWFALLFGVLAGCALLLATLGLHGVMAYNVARRTREIGIRLALGATSRDVTRLVLGQSLRITRLGVVLSLFGALALARLLQLLLRGVQPFDPVLFGGITVLLGGVALLASVRPARRAAATDPQLSLRAE